MISPVSQGSINSQQGLRRMYSGFAQTTTNSAVTILTIPLATSSTAVTINITVAGRASAGVTVPSTAGFAQIASFKNTAGTVTAATTQSTQLTSSDTALSASTLTYTISGTNILVRVTGVASYTIQWTAECVAIFN
jgi:hypothetical protein